MRKLILTLAVLLFLPAFAVSQAVSVTATIQSASGGQPYFSGTYQVSLVDAAGNPLSVPGYQSQFSGSLSTAGLLSLSLFPNSQIQTGSQWKFQICSALPKTLAQPQPAPAPSCFSLPVTITGAGDISSTLNASAPVFYACTQWSGSAWQACSSGSSGSGTVTSVAAPSASWPLWLVPTVTNPTSTPSLAVSASAIPNSALENSSMTINSVSCTLGGSCTISGGGGGTTTNPLTFATSGGVDPGGSFNGAAAVTIDYHSVGAAKALGNATIETTDFSPACNAAYIANDASALMATLPASPGTGCVIGFQNIGAGTLTISDGSSIIYNGTTTLVSSTTLATSQQVSYWWTGTYWTTVPWPSTGTHQWSCQPGMGDGANAIAAATYLQTTCKNTTGSTVTLTGIQCYADAGTPTMNVTNGTGTGLLTGAVTCSSSYAAGTQSATTTLANGDYLKFTFVAGGTAKQTSWVVQGTY